MVERMFVMCGCGAENSAFNPFCATCGAAIVEHRGRSNGADTGSAEVRDAVDAERPGMDAHKPRPD